LIFGDVRVVLASEFAKGFLDIGIAGSPGHTQNFVIIFVLNRHKAGLWHTVSAPSCLCAAICQSFSPQRIIRASRIEERKQHGPRGMVVGSLHEPCHPGYWKWLLSPALSSSGGEGEDCSFLAVRGSKARNFSG